MATRSVKTVDEYLAALPADRRAAIAAVRDTINRRIPRGYEHGMLYGGPAWYVPRSRLAETYNGQPLAVAVLPGTICSRSCREQAAGGQVSGQRSQSYDRHRAFAAAVATAPSSADVDQVGQDTCGPVRHPW